MRNRSDKNQKEIAAALGRVFSVANTNQVKGGFPDLIAGGSMPCKRCGARIAQNLLIEVKGAAGRLTPEQIAFHDLWKGPIVIARSIDEALRLAGQG